MREYFRQEAITYRYWPLKILPRIYFDVLMIMTPFLHWFFILLLPSVSYGTRFTNEVEFLIPYTDTEIKRARIIRCIIVWIRYFILSATGFALSFLYPKFRPSGGLFVRYPLIFATYFPLQLAMTFLSLLESATTSGQIKKEKTFLDYLFKTFPATMFFIYGWSGSNITQYSIIPRGNQNVHVLLLVISTILLIIRCMITYRNWTITDYSSVEQL